MTWETILTYCRTHDIVRYHAPLDLRTTYCRVVKVYKNEKIRLRPINSDADAFTSDPGHIARFELAGF